MNTKKPLLVFGANVPILDAATMQPLSPIEQATLRPTAERLAIGQQRGTGKAQLFAFNGETWIATGPLWDTVEQAREVLQGVTALASSCGVSVVACMLACQADFARLYPDEAKQPAKVINLAKPMGWSNN